MDYKEYKKMASNEIASRIWRSGGYTAWWNYVTALRGPDEDKKLTIFSSDPHNCNIYYVMKEMFTCFIRGCIPSGPSGCGALGIEYFEKIISFYNECTEYVKMKNINETHPLIKNPGSKILAFIYDTKDAGLGHFLNHIHMGVVEVQLGFSSGEVFKICKALINMIDIKSYNYVLIDQKNINDIYSIIMKDKSELVTNGE